jgi:hypothetical protein
MGRQQVILRGGDRKKQILIWSLVIAIGLLVTHAWRPGAIDFVLSSISQGIASAYAYMGSLLDSLRAIVHNISDW